METMKVGIREFRAGLSNYIDADAPVAVTRHGQTVGIFIPTPVPAQADLTAFKQASKRLDALMSLTDDEVEAVVSDFKTARKAAAALRGKP